MKLKQNNSINITKEKHPYQTGQAEAHKPLPTPLSQKQLSLSLNKLNLNRFSFNSRLPWTIKNTCIMQRHINSHTNIKKAFTLVELLTVIAIVSVLSAILIPVAGKAMDHARKSSNSSNLRQIALAYWTHTRTDASQKTINEKSVHQWAAILAQTADLNDPKLWIVEQDPQIESLSSPIPKSIIQLNNSNKWTLSSDFTKIPLSYAVANNLSTNAPASTTPVAWSRGLQPNGQWNHSTHKQPGPYGNKGGFIAFLDGHVQWYEDLSQNGGQLTHYTTKKPTANILDAISPGASVLDYFSPHS